MVATFHRFTDDNQTAIEAKLEQYAEERPIALVLPSLYSELQGQALRKIVEELKKVFYIKEVVVTLGPASEREFNEAKSFFSALLRKQE